MDIEEEQFYKKVRKFHKKKDENEEKHSRN